MSLAVILLLCIAGVIDLGARCRPAGPATVAFVLVVVALVLVCFNAAGAHVWR